MKLTSNQAWPPKGTETVMADLARFDAWYTGDTAALASAYRPGSRVQRHNQYTGKRFWWSRSKGPTPTTTREDRMHLPIAADLATTSSDLLYADHPVISHDNTAIDERLTLLEDEEFFDTIMTGAELGAAFGGRYHRVSWDRDLVPNAPFITTVEPDRAYPTFRFGRLESVTFVTVVKQDDYAVWRHAEHHYLHDGTGRIAHQLYQGTSDNLGQQVPVTDLAETRGLADILNADGEVALNTPTPGLHVVYFPNITPQRRWRKNTFGRYQGRSDFDGIEDFMDAADEVWSSLMREFRLGKARLLIADHMLDDINGTPIFDADREGFVRLPGVLAQTGDPMPIEQVQFNIRVQEHLQTLDRITETIIHQAGYSAASFTEHAGDTDITATEVRAREKRSLTRRDGKIAKETPALRRLLQKLLYVSATEFTGGIDAHLLDDQPVKVEFPAGVQETPMELAQTGQALRAARAASTRTIVQHVNPGWTSTEVDSEVAAILREENAEVMPLDAPHRQLDLTRTVLPGDDEG